jgi:alanyl-tRNA synthetase
LIVVTKESCFYARGGGQEGDQGTFKTKNTYGKVLDTLKQPLISINSYIVLHIVEVEKGEINLNDEIELFVNKEMRDGRTRAHSAIHIVGEIAMRKVNGTPAGSKVDVDEFHLDIKSEEPVTKYIEEILQETQEIINQNFKSKIYYEKKENLKNVLFLEGTNYGEVSRVVEFNDVSRQLCGGTHVKSTGEILSVVIVKEIRVQKGIRRIYGICGKKALNFKPQTEEKKVREVLPKELEIWNNVGFLTGYDDAAAIRILQENNLTFVVSKDVKIMCLIVPKNYEKINLLKEKLSLNGGGREFIRLGSKNELTFEIIKKVIEEMKNS